MSIYFSPNGIREVAELLDDPVQSLPALVTGAVAPDPGMYGKVLIYSAQLVEPMATNARRAVYSGLHAAGQSIVQGLHATASDYRAVEEEAVHHIGDQQRNSGGGQQ